jgi:Zn-dependent protease with chaperone function
MHITLLISTVFIAWFLRGQWHGPTAADASWGDRWHRARLALVVPPLLLLTSTGAILLMGPVGAMVGTWEGWLTYAIAALIWVWAVGQLGRRLVLSGRTWQRLRQLPTQPGPIPFRIIADPWPFSAAIGFWNAEIAASQGLLDTLDAPHLAAVLAHEQAHQHHRDPFWFFWLGWLRDLLPGFPHTDALWAELLLLRELRADAIARQQCGALVVAEALLQVVSGGTVNPAAPAWSGSVGFDGAGPDEGGDRLEERIDALLAPIPITTRTQKITTTAQFQVGLVLLLILLPLTIVPLHG